VKLLGNTAFYEAAMAEALSTANGLFPVSVVAPFPIPMRLLVPELLSLSFIILLDIELLLVADILLPAVLLLLLDFPLEDDLVLLLEPLLILLEDRFGCNSG